MERVEREAGDRQGLLSPTHSISLPPYYGVGVDSGNKDYMRHDRANPLAQDTEYSWLLACFV